MSTWHFAPFKLKSMMPDSAAPVRLTKLNQCYLGWKWISYFSLLVSVSALTLPLWSGVLPPSWPVFPSDACTRWHFAQVPVAGPSSRPLPSCQHRSSDGETHNIHIKVLLKIPIDNHFPATMETYHVRIFKIEWALTGHLPLALALCIQ